MLLMAEPNVLLLDEPTNDLDIDTLTELEDLLDGWPGTLVVVSHDRYFLERVTDHVLALIGDGKLAFLPGGVDEYLELPGRRRGGPASQPGRPRRTSGAAATGRRARPGSRPGELRGGQEGAGQARPAAPAPGQPGVRAARGARRGGRRLRPADRARRRAARLQAEKAALEDRWLSWPRLPPIRRRVDFRMSPGPDSGRSRLLALLRTQEGPRTASAGDRNPRQKARAMTR